MRKIDKKLKKDGGRWDESRSYFRWIRVKYGQADTCDNFDCRKKSKVFQWSLKKGYTFDFKRDNYIKSCRSCMMRVSGHVKKGSKFPLWVRVKMGHKGSKHHGWQGDTASYESKHEWIKRHFGKPTTCETCEKENLTGHWIHWANISGEYKREIGDWKRLCANCHYKFDFERGSKRFGRTFANLIKEE